MEVREVIEWLRFLAGAVFLLIGMAIFIIEMIGVFRFRYVLNRMHAVAMGDTLGIGSCLLGLIIMNGFSFTSLKLFAVIVFLWFSSPVSSHLVARLEVATNEDEEKHYRIKDLDHIKEPDSIKEPNCMKESDNIKEPDNIKESVYIKESESIKNQAI